MERMAPFTLYRPATLAESSAFLAATPGARAIAGGTDLLPNLRDGLGAPAALVDLSAIDGIDALAFGDDGSVRIGAGFTLGRLVDDAMLREALPILGAAASTIAGPGHRTVATVGGNLCLDTRCLFYNQSEWWRRSNDYCLKHGGETCHVAPQGERCHAAFSGDLAPALLALDAEVEIAGAHATRVIPLTDLYVDDGAQHLALAADELVAAVRVPRQSPAARSAYRKVRARAAIDFPLAGVAVRVECTEGILAGLRVALTGVNSRPLLVDGTVGLLGRAVDEALLGALGKLVQKQASPMRTTVTGANYRRQVAATCAQRLVRDLAAATPA